MDYGKKLLTETNLSISEVAEKAGYKAIHNFYSTFKKFYNATPSSYRVNHKK